MAENNHKTYFYVLKSLADDNGQQVWHVQESEPFEGYVDEPVISEEDRKILHEHLTVKKSAVPKQETAVAKQEASTPTKKKKWKFGFGHYSKFDRKNFLFVYCLILLPILQFALFWVYVHIDSIALAFQQKGTGAFTFNNFQHVFNNMFKGANLSMMMLRSLILWCISHLLAFPIALASTYVLYRRVIGHYAFRVIFSISGIVGAVVWVTLLKSILNGGSGYHIVIYVLQNWFKVSLPQKALSDGLFGTVETAFPTLCILSFVFGIAGGSVIVTGAYAKVPPELMEAAKLDGLDFWGSFFHVALPCSWPTISTLLTIALCSMLVVDGNVYLYTNGSGGNGMATMGFYLYSLTVNISKNPVYADYGYPAAVGLLVTAVSVPVVLLGRRIINKVIPTVEV